MQAKETSSSTYTGPVLPLNPIYVQFPSAVTVSESKLNQLGTTAIARCSPSNPTADASVFLKETLSEGIPHLFLDQLKSLRGMTNHSRRKALGESYLNLEFGWKPFVSDLRSISKAILDANATMLQYERDSGKVVRRSYYFPDVHSVVTDTYLTDVSPWITPSGGCCPITTRRTRARSFAPLKRPKGRGSKVRFHTTSPLTIVLQRSQGLRTR
jgi:hypothetical protein